MAKDKPILLVWYGWNESANGRVIENEKGYTVYLDRPPKWVSEDEELERILEATEIIPKGINHIPKDGGSSIGDFETSKSSIMRNLYLKLAKMLGSKGAVALIMIVYYALWVGSLVWLTSTGWFSEAGIIIPAIILMLLSIPMIKAMGKD